MLDIIEIKKKLFTRIKIKKYVSIKKKILTLICYKNYVMLCNGLKRPIFDKKSQSRDFCVEGSFALRAEKQF
jgi:hypothetical protein